MQILSCTKSEALKLLKENNNSISEAFQAARKWGQQTTKGWDFKLPRVAIPEALILGIPSDSWGYNNDDRNDFSLEDLIGAIQGGETYERVREYLTHHHQHLGASLAESINGMVESFPAFFFVVETRNAELVRTWAGFGGDVNVTYGSLKVPLLAFAISLSTSYAKDTTMMVKTLLSLGASVDGIPKAFYTPLDRDLPQDGPTDEELTDLEDTDKQWCTPLARKLITTALNMSFTQRYVLYLAAHLEKVSGASRQVARLHKATDLLGIHYFLIGQVMASKFLVRRLIAELAMPRDRPLIFLFAGPSGHGKTELARNLGKLISLDLHMVDCTSINTEHDMFGPRAPYYGSGDGSPLNNFIVQHSGRRCIVFLDEFEKTKNDVRQTLLIPFQSGEYQDRRDLRTVDFSKSIWILATNAFDQTIHSFCKRHETVLFDCYGSTKSMNEAEKLVQKLSGMIKEECIWKFTAPMAGRIKSFLPFLTFSPCEQAAVADKYLSEFGKDATKPLKISDNPATARMFGNVDVQLRRGYSVCKALAANGGYVRELGARSIINAVDCKVGQPVINSYLDSREEIVEGGSMGRFVVGVCEDSMDVEDEVVVSQVSGEDGEDGPVAGVGEKSGGHEASR
ncbi:P-loop containing nucleoside triphosphate hydrolase protein [Bombardia bombarda]|uniref:P-loop containing nucleoside triphosphate hydrolase protein n=1 Tax=Bombardia bombarda TaxID=252184 RepID=A0AA40C931_9PEZI|nr:P-loop containing nucleoside triphosphate hydrolase protein [Bombardia bombarda]